MRQLFLGLVVISSMVQLGAMNSDDRMDRGMENLQIVKNLTICCMHVLNATDVSTQSKFESVDIQVDQRSGKIELKIKHQLVSRDYVSSQYPALNCCTNPLAMRRICSWFGCADQCCGTKDEAN